ncbi:MAG: hypothetical protein K4305_08905 [Chlorobium sp.]
MKQSWKREQGYTHYVYSGPGSIEYFYSIEEAQAYQSENGGEIGEVL